MHPHSSFKKVGVWLCDTNTHRVNWKGKGEGGMTYECMMSEVNQWKLNFPKKEKKHKVELVEGVFGLNRMTRFGSLGILWLRIRWAYFETASKGNYKRTRISKGNYMWSGTVILQKTQTYIPTRISMGNYMWLFFFFFDVIITCDLITHNSWSLRNYCSTKSLKNQQNMTKKKKFWLLRMKVKRKVFKY